MGVFQLFPNDALGYKIVVHIHGYRSPSNLLGQSRYTQGQELMSGEAAKERVTPVPFKSGLLTYFRFGEAQCASCGLSPILEVMRLREKINDARIASTRNSDSRLHKTTNKNTS